VDLDNVDTSSHVFGAKLKFGLSKITGRQRPLGQIGDCRDLIYRCPEVATISDFPQQ
jgi:hypothetical protein